jgi:hypothetical protein
MPSSARGAEGISASDPLTAAAIVASGRMSDSIASSSATAPWRDTSPRPAPI